MFKAAVPLIVSSLIVLTACSSNYNQDEVPDLSAQELYSDAQAAMATGDFGKARRYLETIDSRYPFGEITDQIQLDLIYVYYKTRENAMTSAAITRYMRLNPNSQYSDYVIFMKGLNEMQKRGDIIQDFLGLNRSQKDPSEYYEAIKTFKNFILTYPHSPYVKDARQRIMYIKDQLAEREFHIAEYYFEREAFLSSIRHCQSILYSYRDTRYLPQALTLMSDSYDRLGLKQAAENTRRVARASFKEEELEL